MDNFHLQKGITKGERAPPRQGETHDSIHFKKPLDREDPHRSSFMQFQKLREKWGKPWCPCLFEKILLEHS
jgi:hypothetical protein